MSNSEKEQAIDGLIEIQEALSKADSLYQALPKINAVKERLIANDLFAYWLEIIETSVSNRWQGYSFGKSFVIQQMLYPSKNSLHGRRDDSEKGRCKLRAEIYSYQIKLIREDGQPLQNINRLFDKYLSGRPKGAVAEHTAYIQMLSSKYPNTITDRAKTLYEIALDEAHSSGCPFEHDGGELVIRKSGEPYSFTAFKNSLSKAKNHHKR